MNLKKYRACLALFVAAVIAVSIIYYINNAKKTEIPADGMLVKNTAVSYDGEHV